LQQRAVDREVVGREQPPTPSVLYHFLEQHPRRVRLQQPLTVLGKGLRMERHVFDPASGAGQAIEVQEPLEQEVVAQLLAELALRANRVEGHLQARVEQVLRRDRRSSASRVDLREQRRKHPNAESASGLSRRSGWSFGTKTSGVNPSIIVACRSLSPRIADIPRPTAQHLIHDLTCSFFGNLIRDSLLMPHAQIAQGTREKVNSKVLDFVQFGGARRTTLGANDPVKK